MRQLQKGDSEYNNNGHYTIDGVDFMSIWTFKNKYGSGMVNSNQVNGKESIELLGNGITFFNSKPDFGYFKEIKIFPVSELMEYYKI